MIGREPLAVRRPEKATRPKVFYKGAHQATLDPLAARRPEGGLYAWNEQPTGRSEVGSGQTAAWNSSAAALLSYDVSHTAPWDWRVSAYTWTKSIASGAYLVALLLAFFAGGSWYGPVWRLAAPVVSAVFLALTGMLLVWDLERPERFFFIFTRPQWRSWLVRGAFIISAYGLVLVAHFVSALLHRDVATAWITLAGVPLATMTAVYTGYLFAQAKARDLWQNPLLPPHLFVQALMAGAAALVPFVALLEPRGLQAALIVLGVSALTHLLFVGAEVTLAHTTAHAQAAMRTMTRGRYASWFWTGMTLAVLCAGACVSPVAAFAFFAVPFSLAALFAYEHAYVQAGQSVPLA
jgi:formate-dependent nitrite reductase membrane component NrfD